MKTTSTRKRPKSPFIQLVKESTPWILVSEAAEESGLTEFLIRKSKVMVRKFGNADYVRPDELNAWILGKEETQP